MILEIDGRPVALTDSDTLNKNDGQVFAVVSYNEIHEALGRIGIPDIIDDCLEASTSKLENRENYDFITVSPPVQQDEDVNAVVCIYVKRDFLVFVCHDAEALYKKLEVQQCKNSAIFDRYFDKLLADDFDELELIEDEIAQLEESITEEDRDVDIADIIQLRKSVLKYKNYYERLYSVADDVVDNENDIYTKVDLKNFRITRDRVDRLHIKAHDLQEQVVQARESYQSQLDISLNKTMKILTVVTSLFLPLTLLVGWYGMNLQMPEFLWEHGYPFVIGLTVAIIILLIFLFKRKKWF